jgi:3-isopropylmalate dehydratase small subunit
MRIPNVHDRTPDRRLPASGPVRHHAPLMAAQQLGSLCELRTGHCHDSIDSGLFHQPISVCYWIGMGKYEDLVGKENWLLTLDGRAWTLGDGVVQRQILADDQLDKPAASAARHLLRALMPGFAARLRRGDFLVAGLDFGADATHPLLPLAMRAAGIGAVIARSFGAAFERAAIDAGLPAAVVEETAAIKQGDRLRVDVEAHVIANKSSGDRYVIRNIGDADLDRLRAAA